MLERGVRRRATSGAIRRRRTTRTRATAAAPNPSVSTMLAWTWTLAACCAPANGFPTTTTTTMPLRGHRLVSLTRSTTTDDDRDGHPNNDRRTLPPPPPPAHSSPFPVMPSADFLALAESQFELLAHGCERVGRVALYLPQENSATGQLEFVPGVVHPTPRSERVFIANDAATGVAPTIPRTLTKLPGFARATDLLPRYPFSAGGDDGADVEIVSIGDVTTTPTTDGTTTTTTTTGSDAETSPGDGVLSAPLRHGSRTAGVLMVWPSSSSKDESVEWTTADLAQVSRAARGLGVALSMDGERSVSRAEAERLRVALAENLHQVRNPLQALRTFGKLLQRRIATGADGVSQGDDGGDAADPAVLAALAENLLRQSDRVADLLEPMDTMLLAPGNSYYGETTSDDSAGGSSWLLTGAERKREGEEEETGGVLTFGRELDTYAPRSLDETFDVDDDDNTLTFRRDAPAPVASSSPPDAIRIGDVRPEMVFVPDVLRTVLDGARVLAEDRGVAFEVVGDGSSSLPGATVCPRSLQEAVSNVLDNALRHCRGRVRVRIAPNDPAVSDPGVTVLVNDDGPGLPAALRERVFERGFTTAAANDDHAGTGIGLYVARTLMERMRGVLDVADDAGGDDDALPGATFRFMVFRSP